MTEQSILLLTRSAEFTKQIRSIGEELGYNIIAAKPGELEREGGRELRLPVIVDADGVSEPVELTRRLVGAGSRVLFAAGGGAEVELPTGSVRLAKPVTHEDLCRALVEVSGLLDPQAADQRPTLGLLRLDGTGRIASINPELAALLGYEKREELLGCSIEDRLTDTADWRKLLTRLQQDGRIIDYELEMITRWGGELTFSFSAIALEDDEGGLTGADCILKLGDGDLGRSMGELRRNLARVLRETARLAAVCTDEAELPGVLEACLPALPTGRLWLLEIDSENQHITACRTLVRRPIGDEFAAPPLDLVGMKRIVGNLERGKSQGGPLSELTRAFRRCLAERGAHSYALVPFFVAAPGELRHSARDDAPPERSWSHLLLWEGLEFVDDEAIEVLEVLGELLTGVLERLAERRLRQSALDEIHRIQENAPVAYQSLDDQGLILEVNDLWLEQLGYRREEVIGKAFNDFCAPKYKERQRANFAAFKERGHIKEAELELLRADGEVLPTLFNGRVERDESGGFVRTHCVFTDISAQKAYEGVVGDSEAQFRSLADNYRDGLVLYSRSSHKMIFINRTFEEIMGLERHKLAGMNLDGLLRGFVHPEDRPYVQERLLETLKLREEGYSAILDLEFRIQRPDGEVRWVRQRSFPRSDALGRITDQSYLGLSDITAAKRVERDLKMRDRILGAVSYAAELLLQPGDFAQDLEEVLENLGRAAGVSRVYLFENHQEKGELTASQRFEWTAPGVEPQIDNPELQRFSYHAAGFTSWVRGMEHGEAVVGRLEELDPATREFLAAQDIRSIAVVPVYTGDEWWGFLGFDECEEDRRWSPAEVEALRSAAGIIGQAVKHQWFRRALERSERRYRLLFNSLSDAVFAFPVDEEGRPGSFISVNDVACERLGYTREEFLRLDLTDIDEPEYFEQAAERIKLIFEEGGAVFESVHRTKDGRRIPVEVNTHLVEADDFNGGGPRRIILSTARDISVRKAAEAALRESEAKYRNLVENANEGIVVAQGEHLVFVNPRMAEFMGLEVAEITRRPFLEFVHPEDRELIAERYARALADDKDIPSNYEFRVLDGAGRTRWMEIRAVLIQWNGAPATLNFLTDITQRYEATTALKASEREKSAILESMQELVAYYNEDLEIQWCNTASARSVGLTPDKLIGRHCYEIWHASDTPCESCPVKEAFESGEPREAPMVTPDGRYWELHGYPVRDDEGRVIGAVEIGLDVTNEQKALQALSESEERHRRYINEAPEAVFIVGPGGRYAQVNRAACEITGYSEAELLELNIGDLLDIEDRESGLELFERVESEGRGKMELAARIKGGQRRFWSISSVRLSETRRMSFVLDITDRVLAERSLERRLRYEKALAAFSGTLLDESAGERIVEKALEPLLKASEADRVYIFENFVDAEAGLCMRQLHEACAAGVEPQTDNPELQRVPYDEGFGRWRELLSTGEVVRGPVADFPPSERAVLEPQSIDSLLVIPIEVNGAWEGFIGFDVCAPERGFEDGDVRLLRTVAEILGGFFGRLRVARALAESEEKFRTLSEQSLLGIAIAQGGEVTYANEALAEIYGLELDELIGHPAERYADYIHPEDRERMIEQLRRKQAGDRDVALHNTFRILRGGVELRWVDQYSRTIDYGGAPADFITLVDITERQLAEETLERHLRYEKALAACSRSLIEEAELEDALRGALTPLLEAAGACRVAIGENFADPEQGLCLRGFYEVEESGLNLPSGDEYFGCLPYAGPMRVIHDTLTAGGIYRGTVSGDDPGLEKLYRARGVMSQLALPISLGEKWWGVLTFEDCREEHDWADRDIGQLRVAASLLGSFFELRRANEALAESEEKFRTLSEQSLLGVAIVQDMTNVYVNQALADVAARPLEELTGAPVEVLLNMVHPEDRRRVKEEITAGDPENNGGSSHGTYRIIDARGTERWIDQYVRRISFGGRPANFVNLVEITERQRAQQALRSNLEFMQTLLDTIPSPVFYKDTSGVYQGCNRSFAEDILGLPVEAIIGRTMLDFPERVPVELAELYHDKDLELVAQPGSQFYESRARTAQGELRTFYYSKATYKNSQGEVSGIVGVMTDIDELRRTEEALRDSERRLSTLMGNLPGMAYRCLNDENWTMLFVSEGALALTGYQPEALIDNKVAAYAELIHPDDRDEVRETVERALAKKGRYELTYRIITAEGAERWVWEQGRGVYDEDERPEALEGFITDITDRVRAEEKEREYTADLALLTETALDFVRLEAEADIWAYIARRLIEIVPGSAVFVAEYDPDSESLIMRDLAGEDPRLEPFFQRFSAVADGAALPLPDDDRRWMLESKLMRFPFSAEALANWNVGEEHAREISETLGVYEIAAMGLVREGKLLGHVAIAPLDGAPLRKGEIVETFLNQASTTLQRQLSERALKVSQARYRFLFENSTALTIIVDLDGVILDTNQAMSEHTGYAKEEVIGRPVLDFIPPGHREDVAGLLERTLNDTPTPETVLPIISADGEITQVLFSQDHATLEQDGKPYAVMITGVDVTERHRAQLALSRELEVNRALSELYPPLVAPDSSMAEITRAVLDKARELTASAHGYVSEVDPVDGVMLSHSLTEMMDDCAVEAAKRTIAFHPDEKGRYGGLWGHALNEGEPFYTNDPAGHPASAGGVPQGHIPLEAFLAYPVSVGGKLLGQIALANPENGYSERDIEVVGRLAEFYALALQRKRYEAALAESEQKLDKMVSTLSEGLVMVDNRGEFIYANPAAAEILEVEVEDFFTGRYDSRKWRQVNTWGEPYPLEELPLTVALRERRSVEHLEHGIISSAEKLKWLSVSAAPLIDEDGRLYGAVASFHDISERRRAEQAKERYISELKLISETAARLNRANDVEEILDIVGERIHNLDTENYLLLTLRDPGEEGITIRRHYGFEGVQEKILSRFNEDPRRMSFRVEEMSEEEHRVYTSGRLEEVHGGLHTLGTGRLPKTITRAVEKLMGVKGVYTMGFSLGEEPFGGLILLRTSEGAPECRFALEAILKQASFLIRRRWAEEALAESEERFRRMADSIQDGLTIIEGDRTVYMNRRVGEIFGYSREEIARKGILEIAAPEERAKLEEAERRAKSSEDYPDVLEFWILTADGEHRCVQNRYSYPDDDPVKGRYIITTDVTAQRRTHEAIVQAKQEWVRTFDTVPDLVAILDDAFRINRVNRAMADKLGVAPHDLIGKLCYELFHGTGEPVSTCPHVQMLSDGREHIGEQKMLGGDYLVSVTPLVDEDGHMQGAVHVARDITESKKARRELFDSRESYRLLSAQFEGMLSAITDRVVFVDSQMQIVWANRAVEQYVGLPTEELRGRDAHAIWEDAGQCRNCVVEAAFNNGRREDCIRIENERRFEVTAFPVFDAKSIIGVIEVMRDVTEQHEAQEAVQRQAMVNQVEQIFSSIRHEIGNALNTLKTTITVLKGNIDTFPLEKRETYFRRILDTFKVAERLLRTLKEYQKFDELESELLFLDRFLREKGGLLVDNAFNNDVVLKLKLGCPHILVRVDRDALIRVLLNIVDNAISACRERPAPLIELASRCTDDWAVVTITDNGTGIAKKDLPNVFTPLYTTKTEGSGLGLAIVQKLVQQMGGLVRLDSYEDQGTRVTIRLPLVTDYSEDELPIK